MQPRQFISKLSPKGWLAVGGAAAAAIVFLVLVMQFASAPSYTTMMAGLDPAQTGKITAALDSKGISYQLQNNGTALAVQPGQEAQARIALAGAGLLTQSGSSALSSVSNMSLGASNFQQQIVYTSALETQLAQTIEQIQGISSAQVQLALPSQQDQLFGDSTPASGAVLLSDDGSLDSSAVRGIAQLVSSSVPGLSSSKVTITDSTGALLWPTSDSGAGGDSLLAKQDAETRYDAQVEAQVNAMLTQELGAGKAVVQVNADLNTNQTTQQSLTYGAKGVPLTQTKQVEALNGASTAASGAAGTASNVPGVAGTTGSGGTSKYNNSNIQTTYGVNKTVTNTTVTPGAVNRQTVNVTFDKSVPAATQKSVLAAVSSAVGLNPTRGDAITSGTVTFAKAPVAAAPAATSKMLGYAKYVVIGLGALFFLFFVSRFVKRRESEGLTGEPTWLRELEVPRPLASVAGSLGAGPRPAEMAAMPDQPTLVTPLTAPVNVARRQVEDLVERDSDRVAQQVRAWMSED